MAVAEDGGVFQVHGHVEIARRAAHAYLALVCVGMQIKAMGTVIVELEPCGQVDRGKHVSVELSQRLQLELFATN